MHRNRWTLTLALLLVASAASAQIEIDRRRPAPARGEVSIHNPFGSVTVRGWDRAEVAVRGTLAAGVESFDLDGDKEGVAVDVDVPESWYHAPGEDPAFRSTLEVQVPKGARVSVRTLNASIEVEGVTGRVEIDTVNGRVHVASPAALVEVETMTGDVEVAGARTPADVRTISGSVHLAGVGGEVEVESVSGAVEIDADQLASLRVETTTGGVTLRGAITPRGSIDVETFSGSVRLELAPSIRAEIELETFSGEITSDFCAGTPIQREPFEPFHRLRCSTGSELLEIQIRTHDAGIALVAAGQETKGARP